MDLYRTLKPLLFRLDAETSHDLTIRALSAASRSRFLCDRVEGQWGCHVPRVPTKNMGIDFRNPVGLAAGLDKNASAVNAFAAMGFGWLEIGTVTPLPQSGNPKKRMFRIASHDAIINRMGFNSCGLEKFLQNLKQRHTQIPIGINIGKNAATPLENATDDYITSLDAVYRHADYITINISSPNTKDLRSLQDDEALDGLLEEVQIKRLDIVDKLQRPLPIALKIAPDLNQQQIETIAQLVLHHQIDAVIATNTTTQRPKIESLPVAAENGGLSGKPVRGLSNDVIRTLRKNLDVRVPIIGVGGILSADDAWEKIEAGASAVQIYTGLIYHGPQLLADIAERCAYELRRRKLYNFNELVRSIHQ